MNFTNQGEDKTPGSRFRMAPRFGRALAVLRRMLVHAIPTAIGIVVLNFMLLQLTPGDIADVVAAESGVATAQSMAETRRMHGLDRPMVERLGSYLAGVATLDLGYSQRFATPVIDLIAQRLPGTLLLMVSAITLALLLGCLLGSVMAMYAGRLPDRVLSVIALLFYSIPSFWIGLVLIVLFSVKLGWLPSGGMENIASDLTGFAAFADRLRYMVLPVTSLALFYVAVYARLTRAAMLEVKSQDYVRTAAAKGLSTFSIVRRHILRNALLPITTVAGMHVGGLLSGAVVVETIYSWPGLGRLAFDAVMGRDYTVLLGVLLLSSLVVIAVNILVDLLHAVLDPRIGSAQ